MKTWRRLSSPAAWAVALVLSAPALVQAQTQLFPLAPIQRERVPCPMEDPVYGLYRHQYYGYFPTCWRPFPPGWGCPSPEAPNAARAFQDRPRDKPPESLPAPDDDRGLAPIPGEEPALPRGRNQVPPLPNPDRSPFDLDTAPSPTGGAGAPPREGRANPTPIRPAMSRNAAPLPPPVETERANDASAPLLALPDPAETFTKPAPTATPTTAPAPDSLGFNGVLHGPVGPPTVAVTPPALPDPSMGHPGSYPVTPPPSIETRLAGPPPSPIQAPQRRGPIGTLFNGMTSRLRR